MTHREAIKEWLATINLENKTVIDWGSGAKPASRYINHSGCKFYTIDQNPLIDQGRRSANHITGDIEQPWDIAMADVAFCMEVLEHCWDGLSVLLNIRDNLIEGGTLYMSLPFMVEIHADDDYHRYTDKGIKKLLEEAGFQVLHIRPSVGPEKSPQGFLIEATL